MVHRRLIPLAVGIMLALAACSPSAGVGMLDTSCQAPCWHGITPGTTTIEDALEIIPQIPGVSARSIAVRDEGGGREYVHWVMTTGTTDFFVELTTADGRVSAMLLSLEGEVSLKDLLLAYGVPEDAGGFYGRGEGHWRRVFLLFHQGLAAVLADEGWPTTNTWRLRPSNGVEYLYFFKPDSLQQLVQDDWLFVPLAPDVESLIAARGPWEGYSTVTLHPARW
jgi:hypothetical protein